jgi:hypothetical protein
MAKPFTENPNYDYESAREAGMSPQTAPGPNKGHWQSRVSSGPKEGLMLKTQPPMDAFIRIRRRRLFLQGTASSPMWGSLSRRRNCRE